MLGLGAGMAGKLYVVAVVAMRMFVVGARNGLVPLLWMVGVMMIAGAVGGTVHGLLWRLEGRGRPGSWLWWVGTLLGACAAAVLLTPRGPFRIGESMTWILAVAISGLSAGFMV